MTKQPIYMQIVDNEQSFQHPKFYGKTGIKSLIQTDKTRKHLHIYFLQPSLFVMWFASICVFSTKNHGDGDVQRRCYPYNVKKLCNFFYFVDKNIRNMRNWDESLSIYYFILILL